MSKIKIAIADDYKIFREGLAVILTDNDDMEIILEADTAEELLLQLERTTPDVLLLDLKMPGMGGIKATSIIRERFPTVKILIISMYEDEKFVTHMLKSGAHGYLLKNDEPDKIRKMIYDVMKLSNK
jgi:DNA-binding NarL/FixJ family response regulator